MIHRPGLDLFGDSPSGRVRLLGAAVVACIALIALALTVVYRTSTNEDIRRQTLSQCRQIEQLKGAITDVLEDGRARLNARRYQLDPAEYQAAVAYYRTQINRFRPKEC